MQASNLFIGLWPVESRYEIVDWKTRAGVMRVVVERCGDSGTFRLIEPCSPRIASELGSVENEKELLAFNHKFGLLGHDRLAPEKKRCGGDPVLWSLRHARRVAAIMEMFQAITRGGPDTLRKDLPGILRDRVGLELIGSETEVVEVEGKKQKLLVGRERLLKPNTWFYAEWPDDPLRVAWKILSDLISEQIRGLRVELSERELTPVLAFDALIQAIYWQLAGELKELSLRRCSKCRKFFTAKRSDAQYCSPKCRMSASRKRRKNKKHRRRR